VPAGARRTAAAVAVALAAAVLAAACADGGGPSPRPTTATSSSAPPVVAAVETDPLPRGSGDVSDDSAIWVDAASPSRSVVFGDSKDTRSGGIAVYGLDGTLLQFRPDGRIGNVDVRGDFPLGDRRAVLVGANDRSDDTLLFWEYDPATRHLSAPVTAGPIRTQHDNYGFCLYRSPTSGKVYGFVDQSGGGQVRQYELDGSSGRVTATQVRSFDIGGQTEGCVADDETGQVYFGEEDVAIWQYGAEPGDGTARTAVDRVGGHVEADIEGMAIAHGPGGSGYLLVSSQGDSRIVAYQRGSHAFVRSFRVHGSGEVDAVSSTDGLDVTTADLGPRFPHGLLVVHDGDNDGGRTSNLKFVPLQEALGPSGG
jgi:3-phytase